MAGSSDCSFAGGGTDMEDHGLFDLPVVVMPFGSVVCPCPEEANEAWQHRGGGNVVLEVVGMLGSSPV